MPNFPLVFAEGDNNSFAIPVSDPDGDAISIEISGLPPGLSTDVSQVASQGFFSIAGNPSGGSSGPHTVAITVSDSAGQQTVYSIDVWVRKYGVSPNRNKLLISEILYQERGPGGLFDEFVEIYNASDEDILLTGMSVAIHSRKDTNSEHGVGPYVFPSVDDGGQVSRLNANETAVLWLWNDAVPASQPESLRFIANTHTGSDILLDAGDDWWFLDQDLRIIDYVAYNNGAPGSEILNPPAAVHDFWVGSDTLLGNAAPGQSISRATGGAAISGPTCWELTGSGNASCADVLGVTHDVDPTSRVASPGEGNLP